MEYRSGQEIKFIFFKFQTFINLILILSAVCLKENIFCPDLSAVNRVFLEVDVHALSFCVILDCCAPSI